MHVRSVLRVIVSVAILSCAAPLAGAQERSGQEEGQDIVRRLRSDLDEALLQIAALQRDIRMLDGRFQARFHRFMDRRWQNVTGQRQQTVTYTNEFDVPIEVSLVGESNRNRCYANLVIDGVVVATAHNWNDDSNKNCFVGATVPPGSRYGVVLDGYLGRYPIRSWFELRPVQ